jgi:hypothetical protein
MARSDLSRGDEGTYVGAIGAGCVALWFFVIDLIQGHPLRTPSVLGQVLLFGQARPDLAHVEFAAVIAYTAVHFALFLAFGLGLVALIRWAARESAVRYAILQVFLVFEVLFYGLLSLVSQATRELFPFWTVLGANTFAAITMAFFLYRQHPEFRQLLRDVPLGAAPVK